MSGFSLTITTSAQLAAQQNQARAETLKAECRRRILAVLSETTQMNLASDAAAGRLEAQDSADYAAALAWRDAMRARLKALAGDPQAGFNEDADWPAPDARIVDLAKRF